MITPAELQVRSPYSLILVGDRKGELPPALSGRLVAASDSLIAVGTMSEADGPTLIRILPSGAHRPPSTHLRVFEGSLNLDGVLTASSVEGQIFLEVPISTPQLGIEVWVNDAVEPDEISILLK